MFFPNPAFGFFIISIYASVISRVINGIPVAREAFFAESDEKKGVSKQIQVTLIPCCRSNRADNILSNPPEQSPSPFVCSLTGIILRLVVFFTFIYKYPMTISASKIKTILKTLRDRYPVVKTQLEHDTPFQLLIATILSAQCTDKQVNKVSKKLFEKYPDAGELGHAPLNEIKKIIYSTGFYNNKAKNIKACALEIFNLYKAVVPEDIEKLVMLPGVGRKTANVVLSAAFGHDAIVVDTHVLRISRRLGLTENRDPVKVEYDLMAHIPKTFWSELSLQLIYFGREICDARNPHCEACPLFHICPAKGRE